MPLITPRDMISQVRWRKPQLKLIRRQQISRTAGGRVNAQDLGPPIWTAEFESVPRRHEDAARLMTDFETLNGAVHSFYLYDPLRPWPASLEDPDGSALEAATVTVSAIHAQRTALTLTGLPVGFVLTGGDYISIETITGIEFFKIARANGGTANASGTTPEMEVVPAIRPSVAVGNAVTLIKPMVEMRLEPGSLDDPWRDLKHRAITFKAVQVIR